MNAPACSLKARRRIPVETRRALAQNAGFACSICGSIPIVFHHIEEWARTHSNDEALLMPICDRCHRRIHGEGGSIYSKDDLRRYKSNPKRPSILQDHLPLEGQTGYAFFVGSNFAVHAQRAMFGQPGGYPLLSIDTSEGTLKLSVLAGVEGGTEHYLIQDNELLLAREGISDMTYSGGALKVWKTAFGKKAVFIDLLIKPDVIIIREMNTTFNGLPFTIGRLRAPQQRQVARIQARATEYEQLYHEIAAEIDNRPPKHGAYRGMDIDLIVTNLDKDQVRTRMERELRYEFCREFPWDWSYYQWVLNRVLAQSEVFRTRPHEANLPPEFQRFEQAEAAARAKYQEEFADLQDVIAQYGGVILSGNISL